MMKTLLALSIFVIASISFANIATADLRSEKSTLAGKITNPDGQPLSGVRVDITTAAPKVGPAMFCPSCYLDCRKWDTTNETGEFQLTELDPGLKFRLVVAGPGLKTRQTELIDPLAGSVSIMLQNLPPDQDPSRIVSGEVVSEDGIPIAGAFIDPYGGKTAARRWHGSVSGVDPTVSDHKGQFAMLLPENMLALDIEITADGFCGVLKELLEPGTKPVALQLPAGAEVTGKLVHKGQPVVGMSLAVVQTQRSGERGIFIAAVGDVTRDDGSFKFQHLPFDQQYAIYTVAGEARLAASDFVLTTKVFKVPGSGEARDLGLLTVTRSVTIRGRVERVDDLPLPENLKLSFGRDPAWDLIGIPVADDGSFKVTGLPPETYKISVSSDDLVVVPEKLAHQMLGERSFGIHVTQPVDGLVIPVKAK